MFNSYKKSIGENKFMFWSIIISISFSIYHISIVNKEGRYIPPESELNYSEGVINTYFIAKSRGEDIRGSRMYDKKTKQYLEFSCDYTAAHQGSNSNCRFLEKHNGEEVKVGWYRQPDFLYYSNKRLQLVTVHAADGTVIRSYDKWLRGIKSSNTFNNFGVVFFLLLGWFLMHFGVFNPRGVEKKEETDNTQDK